MLALPWQHVHNLPNWLTLYGFLFLPPTRRVLCSDPAWVVGASYICYAPLLNGSTTVMFDGKPVGAPDADAYWRVCRCVQPRCPLVGRRT